MYTFERGEEHDTLLKTYDRFNNLVREDEMIWTYISEDGFHPVEKVREYA